jgi:hypothetical protein
MAEAYGSVRRRSVDEIERLAKMVRQELGVGPGDRLAMQPVLEFMLDDMVPDAYLAVENDQTMGGAEGRTDWHQPVITLSAGTYVALTKSDPRARMTAAHELGHLLMHTQQPVYYYRSKARDQRVDPEWQANVFAAALLMPRSALRKMSTVSQVKRTFGVSRGAALRWARELNIPLLDDTARRPGGKKKGYDRNRTP